MFGALFVPTLGKAAHQPEVPRTTVVKSAWKWSEPRCSRRLARHVVPSTCGAKLDAHKCTPRLSESGLVWLVEKSAVRGN